MAALADAGLHQPVGLRAIGLERAGGVHHHVRPGLLKLCVQVAVAVERRRLQRGLGGQGAAERLGPGAGAAGDDEGQRRLVGQQLRQPPAEGPVTADDQHPRPRAAHPRNLSA